MGERTRQKAFYRAALERQLRTGEQWPIEKYQAVANKFPDLWMEFQDRVLGAAVAAEARATHAALVALEAEEARTPKPGNVVELPGSEPQLVVAVNRETSVLTIARNTRWNRARISARIWLQIVSFFGRGH